MGGLGSGRNTYFNAKSIAANYHSIDIRRWRREGFLIPGTTFITKWLQGGEATRSIQVVAAEKCVILSYCCKNPDESKDIIYSIEIEWAPCNLGGSRPWFRCPLRNCGRRSAILYGGTIFACRYCYQLAYSSQRENIGNRATRKAEKIRKRLGWAPGILNGEELKPKGMHWKTFIHLRLLHNNLVNISHQHAALRFGINFFDLI